MPKPGTTVGSFRLRHLVAVGGMAEVYLAEKVGNACELFALKRLLPALAKNPLFADMFAHEANICSKLHHKNIVRCYEFLRDGQDLYMVLEFVLGKEVFSLGKVLQGHSFSERLHFALSVGAGVSDALVYVHERDIVHGDISPQNIMIADARVLLYDFGAAATCDGTVFDEKLVRGNVRYMSPEQQRGEVIDRRSDVFSLALVMLETIISEAEFADVVEKIRASSEFDPRNALYATLHHQTLTEFFAGALAYDRERRFVDCTTMSSRIEELVREFGVDASTSLQKASELPCGVRKKSTRAPQKFFLSLSSVIASAALVVWLIASVSVTWFDARNLHKIPYWPEANMVDATAALPLPNELPSVQIAAPVVKSIAQKKSGTLFLLVKPWAEVSIDGQFLGSTPMGGISLPEGQYLVQLRNPDKSAVALKVVKIYADKKTELIYSF